MKLENKMKLLSGQGMWHTNNLEGRIDTVWMSDGPHGLRAQSEAANTNNDSIKATCFPTASALAASWDTELIGRVAGAIADEAKSVGVSVLLGPGTNMKRSPLCGRNFEYFSEDPYLAGKLAAGFIKAVQEKGVGTSLKHFAANSQETHRMQENNQIDERTLNEIYLRAFEIAVKEAQPATIMASYNRLNGKYACENKELLTVTLREKWGFKGAVVSDWGACLDLAACVKAGMDIEMPGNGGVHLKLLKEAYGKGEITEKEITEASNRVIKLVKKYGHRKAKPLTAKKRKALLSKNHRLAAEAAAECAVLLKNDGLLPLNSRKRCIVIGDLAQNMRIQGGGSSHINTDSCNSFFDVLVDKGVRFKYEPGYDAASLERDPRMEFAALSLIEKYDLPVIFFGGLTDLTEGEGFDRPDMEMPENQKSLLNKIKKLGRKVIFVSFGGSPYNMAPADFADAILHMYLGGEGVAEAAYELLFGEKNPCGKLAETFPVSLEDTPAYGNFGEDAGDDICYKEGIYIGYRYYDSMKVPVRYPFGYGLSYTSFEYSGLKVAKEGGRVIVSFTVTNTGDRAGREISQVYVKNPQGRLMRAEKELRAFSKIWLEAGESKHVELVLDDRAFSVYDVDSHRFRQVKGAYEILVGASSQDIRLTHALKYTAVGAIENAGPETLPHIMSDLEFAKLYGKPLSRFGEMQSGEYDMSSSLNQLSRDSKTAAALKFVAERGLSLMFFGKDKKDPEVRMFSEVLLNGPLDVVVCQSKGILNYNLAKWIIKRANKKKK